MSQLSLIIKTEFLNDVRSKGFWIGTIVVPLIMVLFGVVMGFFMKDADTFNSMAQSIPVTPSEEDMTAAKAVGMLVGMFLTFFLMIYGSMIFNKVRTEKCNRIMEILSTCVDGRTMMLAKIISVGLLGIVQLLAWGAIFIVIAAGFLMVFQAVIPWHYLLHPLVWLSAIYMILYFIGGYVLYGSLYAACGAITDKDNENQAYMTVITLLLLGAFYIGQFAVDHGTSAFAVACNYIPFTSPTVGTINAISGASPVWQTILSLVVLYASAALCVIFAGKLYRSSLLLKGKQFSPRDIITFIRS